MSRLELVDLPIGDGSRTLTDRTVTRRAYVQALTGQCEAKRNLEALATHDLDALLVADETVDAGGLSVEDLSGIFGFLSSAGFSAAFSEGISVTLTSRVAFQASKAPCILIRIRGEFPRSLARRTANDVLPVPVQDGEHPRDLGLGLSARRYQSSRRIPGVTNLPVFCCPMVFWSIHPVVQQQHEQLSISRNHAQTGVPS